VRQQRSSGRVPKWPFSVLLLLSVFGAGTSRAQEGRGTALVIKGMAQYEDSALFEAAIATLDQAVKSQLRGRDSTRAHFYLAFSNYKLGRQEEGSRFLRMIAQRDPEAKLPVGAEEFAEEFQRIRQNLKEGIVVPIEQPPPPPADTAPPPRSQPPRESVSVKSPVYTAPRPGNYIIGASAGALLGLAAYSTSVLFDNLAADKVKAYGGASDSASAARMKDEAFRYHSLGNVFYYSSYPLIALGFYVGLRMSERLFPEKVAFLGDDSPTRVYCSLDKDLSLSVGLRRSIW